MALITQAQIITRLSGRGLDTSQISNDDIAVCELRYVRDILGQDLYDAVAAGSGTGGDYKTFTDTYVQPVLAWACFHHVFDRIQVEVSDRGVFQLQGDRAQVFDRNQVTAFKATLAENLNAFTDEMIRYVVARVEAKDVLFLNLYEVDDEREESDKAVILISNTRRTNHV